MRHLLQRTTAHNRQQKTTFVSQFITHVLTKSSVNFNQGLRAMTRTFCAQLDVTKESSCASGTNKFHSGKLCSAPLTKFFPYADGKTHTFCTMDDHVERSVLMSIKTKTVRNIKSLFFEVRKFFKLYSSYM